MKNYFLRNKIMGMESAGSNPAKKETTESQKKLTMAELEEQKIKEEFRLAEKAYKNLQFGGKMKENEDGFLYTEIADVFVHENLSELDEAPLKISHMGGSELASFFYGTPESDTKRSEAIEKIEFFLGLPDSEDEKNKQIKGSQGFKDWFADNFPAGKEHPELEYLCDVYVKRFERFIFDTSFLSQSQLKDKKNKQYNSQEASRSMLSVLKNPEKFEQAFSKFDEWAKNKFNKESLPSNEDFDEFVLYGITPESYFQTKLHKEDVFIKEKIKSDPFVSKALSCMESTEGELKIQESKKDVVRQLREIYKDEFTKERISLLTISAKTLFNKRFSIEELPGQYRAGSIEEKAVALIVGKAIYFKNFDHDADFYRTVFDPADIYKIRTYSAEGNYPFHQAYVYALYGQEGGDEVISNLKYLGDMGEAKAREEQLNSKTKKYFETTEVGEKVFTTNPAMFAYFKELIDKAGKLNSPEDTVRHYSNFAKTVIDEACTVLAYEKTEGSTDMSSYSNPSSSHQEIIVWKDGKEKSFNANNVSSFELVSEGGKTQLVKHLEGGDTKVENIG